MEGQLIDGRYRLSVRLGEGGMGEVWRAFDERMRREVAIKLLLEMRVTEDGLARFEREARIAGALSSPAIVTVHDYGHSTREGRVVPYLVMELLAGRTLDRIVAAGPTDLRRALSWTVQVCRALETAHAAGVVHRDIKPANILVTADDSVKVLDFGIARFVEDANSRVGLTAAGMVIGTAAFMSPEQASGMKVDARSDLYSLGCVLHYLVCGRPPFTGDNFMAMVYQHLSAVPAPPSVQRPGLPPALDRLVLDLLEKTPDARPADAAAVRARLTAILAELGEPIGSAVANAQAPAPAPAPAPIPATPFPGADPVPTPNPTPAMPVAPSQVPAWAAADTTPLVADRRPDAVPNTGWTQPLQPVPPTSATPRRRALLIGAVAGVGAVGAAAVAIAASGGGGSGPVVAGGSTTGSPTPTQTPSTSAPSTPAPATTSTSAPSSTSAAPPAGAPTPLPTGSVIPGTAKSVGLTYKADGHTLVSVGEDGVVRWWDTHDPKHPVAVASAPTITGSNLSVSTNSAGTLAFAAANSQSTTGVIGLTDISDPAHPHQLGGTMTWTNNFNVLSSQGNLVAVNGTGSTFVLWDVTDRSHPQQLATPSDGASTDGISNVLFRPDGKAAVTLGDKATVWSLASPSHPEALADLTVPTLIWGGGFSTAGHLFAAVGKNGDLALWNMANLSDPRPFSATPLRATPAATSMVGTSAVAFSSDDKTMVVCFGGYTAVWDVSNPAKLTSPIEVPALPAAASGGNSDFSVSAAFNGDNSVLAVGYYEGAIQLWKR